jgi:uncharacterized protein
MRDFSTFVVRHRGPVLLAIAIATIFFAVQAATIRIDTDVLNYFPDNDPDVRFFKETGGKFGSNYINMVALESENIFSAAALGKLSRLTKDLSGISGVDDVLSLSNVPDMQLGDGMLTVAPLFDAENPPTSKAVISELKDRVMANPLLVGNLVSEDCKAALIVIRVQENADKELVARNIRQVAGEAVPGEPLFFGGFSMVMAYMGELVLSEGVLLVPLSVLMLLGALYLGLGTLRGVVVPMAAVGVSIVWTLGVMGYFELPVSMLSAMIPVVVLAVATALTVLLMTKFESIGGEDSSQKASAALHSVGGAIAVAGLTGAIGFASVATAHLVIFKQFAVAAATGAATAAFLSLTFVPAVLSYLSPKPRHNTSMTRLSNRMNPVVNFTAKRSGWVLAIAAAICITSFSQYGNVQRNVNLLSYFPDGSEPRVAERLLQERFGGSGLIIVNFRGTDTRSPAVLWEMDRLVKGLRTIEDVNLPQSGAAIVARVNRMFTGEPGLPDTMEKVHNLWLLLEGESSLEQFIEANNTNAVVQARIGAMDTAIVADRIERIEHLMASSVRTDLTTVTLAEHPLEIRKQLAVIQARSIATNLAHEVEFFLEYKRKLPPDFAAGLVKRLLADRQSTQSNRQAIRKRFATYLGGPSSEVLFYQAEAAEAAAEILSGFPDWTALSVSGVLNTALHPDQWSGTPEDVAMLAESLRSKSDGYWNLKRHREALSDFCSAIGVDPADPKAGAMIEDASVDLWALNFRQIAIPTEDYSRIFGKSPPEKNRTQIEVRLTGLPPVSAKFEKQLVRTQVESVLLALFGIFLVFALWKRSFKWGLIGSSVPAFTVLVAFGVMGLFRMPLDNTTVMVSSIAMGIGAGFSARLFAGFFSSLSSGDDAGKAIGDALTQAGPAIIISAFVVAVGFLVMVFSDMIPQKRFGALMALILALGAVASITVLPALMVKANPVVRRETDDSAEGNESS